MVTCMIFNVMYYYFLIFAICIGISLGIVSGYMVTRRWSILGDIISHAALPGVAISFLITHSCTLPGLLSGAMVSSFLSILIGFYIQKRSALPKDSSFALVLACFFSLGIIVLNIIQKSSIPGQSILNNFIFGNILMLNHHYIWVYVLFAVLLLFFTILFFKKKEFFAFDKNFSELRFKNIFLFEALFLSMHIITIILGLQAIGILLIGGFIIIPGSFARLFCTSFLQLVFLSSIISMVSFVLGIHTSFLYPWIPTGPLCLLFGSIFFMIGFLVNMMRRKG